MVAQQELFRLAIRVVFTGELAALRQRFSMSRTTMAALMGVSPESLKRWENGHQGMKLTTALRIANWYQGALAEEEKFLERGGRREELIPLTSFISPLGISQQTVLKWCEEGDIEYENLGPLGIFIYRHELDGVRQDRA